MKHILIVEDDDEGIYLLQLQLNRLRCLSSVCCDMFMILERVKQHLADALIVDINMVGFQLNGIEVIRQVRKIDKNIKIIVLTAVATSEMKAESLRAGASYFMTKPYTMVDLKTTLEI